MTARHRLDGAVSLVAGLAFGAGLVLSGMTQPAKVHGFLHFFGRWDASLAFVMGGAVMVNALAWQLARRRMKPLLAERFSLPARSDLDPKLLAGAGLFGVGWGLGGFCPGPALTSLASGAMQPLVFVLAMLLGLGLTAAWEHRQRAVELGASEGAPEAVPVKQS